jgi:hypothetical protein
MARRSTQTLSTLKSRYCDDIPALIELQFQSGEREAAALGRLHNPTKNVAHCNDAAK